VCFFNVHNMVYVKLVLKSSVVQHEFLEVFFSHVVNVGCLKVMLCVLIRPYFLLRLSLSVP